MIIRVEFNQQALAVLIPISTIAVVALFLSGRYYSHRGQWALVALAGVTIVLCLQCSRQRDGATRSSSLVLPVVQPSMSAPLPCETSSGLRSLRASIVAAGLPLYAYKKSSSGNECPICLGDMGRARRRGRRRRRRRRLRTPVQPCGVHGSGLGASAIPALPAREYGKKAVEDDDDCAVCLDELQRGEVVKQLPACAHLFHKGCIDAWLRWHVTCPVCRSPGDSTLPMATQLGRSINSHVA
ncbi:hypothetical protein U9M48_027470 [Paspalum notatum var. saurae]|uniref:RING-type E3 ubiquitin transferase n=1 Tax=Paspalum notatum var. saurae TaxID=547442 RepID=A0AAQ3WZH2_PASNO